MEQIERTRSGHVVIGVDTHKHIHVAAVMDSVGRILATMTIATDTGGFRQLLDWASTFGRIIAFGIEGTGSYGGALTSYVRRDGHKVIEVSPRPPVATAQRKVRHPRCRERCPRCPGRVRDRCPEDR